MEIVPPPVYQTTVPNESRLPGGWIAFLIIFLLYASVQFVGIFSKEPETVVSVATEEITIKATVKQELMMSDLAKMSQGAPVPTKSSLDSLKTTEDQLKEKMDESSEAAALLLTSQTIRGVELDGMALDKLILSEDPKLVSLGEAFEGSLKNASEIKRNDLVGKVAQWKAKNPNEKKIPLSATGVGSNVVLATVFMLYLMGVFVGGLSLGAFYLVKKFTGSLPSAGFQNLLTNGQADRHAMRMFFYMLAFVLLSIIGASASNALNLDPVWTMVGYMFLLALMIPSIVTLAINGPKLPLKAIWGDTSEPFKKVLWGIGGFMVNFPIAITVLLGMSRFSAYLPTPGHEATEMIAKSSGPGMMLGLFLVIAVFAPLIEEPTFRGLLAPALGKIMRSPAWGIVVSGIMFAIIHPQGPVVWPSLAIVGISAAILTRQTGSLIPAVVLHFCHNATIVMLTLVMK